MRGIAAGDWPRVDARAIREFSARAAVALAALALVTAVMIPFDPEISPLNTGLIYLLLVVLLAARWGWAVGLLAAVGANVLTTIFFTEAANRFTVREAGNVLELAVFLAVAGVTSWLLSRARTGEATARRREQETAVLYDLSRLIIVTPATEAVLATICRRVQETFEIEGCAVLLPQNSKLAPVVTRGPVHARTAYERRAAEEAYATGDTVFLGAGGRRRPRIVGTSDRNAPVVYVPLRVGTQAVGVLEVAGTLRARVFTVDELRLLEAFADVMALAVDRERLLHEAAGAEALKETDRLKSALLSAVSHDLRTPLASIKSAVSGLLDPSVAWDEATREELLTAVDEETDRLTHFVANLLDLSRIEGGALHPETDWYDVRELLETVTARLGRTVTRHRIVLDVADDTGAAPLDYVQIGQVLTNLIENATKFAPEGGEIRVGARRLAGAVEVSVSDAGPGVPPEEREAVFEKFYRVRRSGPRSGGAGLGLAISKGLVEAHGGRIRVDEAPEGGARFVFTLPAEAPTPVPSAAKRGRGASPDEVHQRIVEVAPR